jgi:hypothetical protein
MHLDKIVARILLIFSVANIALAAPVRQRHLDVAKAASQKRGPNSDNGETGDSPPESSSGMPPHDGLTNGAESSSAAANRITTQASGAPVWGNGATGDLRPELSAPVPLRDHVTALRPGMAWLLSPDFPESSSAAENRITTQASGAPVWGNGATGDLRPELSPPPRPQHIDSGPTDEWARLGHVTHVPSRPQSVEWSSGAPPESGATTSSPSDSAHLGDLYPPHQGSSPESLAAPEADRLFTDALTPLLTPNLKKAEILLYSGVIGGTAALAYGIHKWMKHPYVSPLFPADI